MENKKNIIIILLVIVIAILSGVIGFVLGNKNNDSSLKVEEKNESKQDIINKDEAMKLVSKYITGFPNTSVLDEGLTQDVMMESTLTGLLQQDISKYSCSKFYTNENGYTIVDGVEDTYYCTDYANAYDYDKLNKIYKEYYGYDKEMPKRSFTTNNSMYVYSYISEENVFVYLSGAFGIQNLRCYGIKNVENDSNSLSILVSYDNITSDIGEGYIPSFDKSLSFTYEEVTKETFGQELVDKHGSKMSDVEFVFEKENNNYILKSVNKK